jgi:hypothetical protein
MFRSAISAAVVFLSVCAALGQDSEPPRTALERTLTTREALIATERTTLLTLPCGMQCYLRVSRLRVSSSQSAQPVVGFELWSTHASGLLDLDETPRFIAAITEILSAPPIDQKSPSGRTLTYITRDHMRIDTLAAGSATYALWFSRQSYFALQSDVGRRAVDITADQLQKIVSTLLTALATK